jgi:hypothetical protein
VEFVTIGLGEKQVSSNSSETTVPFGSVQVYLILKKENLTAVTAAVHLTAALVSEHIAQIAAESFPCTGHCNPLMGSRGRTSATALRSNKERVFILTVTSDGDCVLLHGH